ncbi:MAG: ABC transporter ATP-binding protein [Pseudonocardiales bacterium]|nr:ABC transporter ATP-binding protein [Pseudonocardiales bacterium]MBV9649992.1 ABC transporter ATP-binding protein [Pseudonocardiales bacterium]
MNSDSAQASPPQDSVARQGDRLLWSTGQRGGWWICLLALVTLLGAGAEILLPTALGSVLDALPHGTQVTTGVLACVALIATMVISNMISNFATGTSNARCTAWLRMTLVQHLVAIGPAATRRFEPGDLVTRVTRNASEAGQVGMTAVMVAAGLIPPVGGIVALLLIDPWVGLAALAGLLVMATLLRIFVRHNTETIRGYLHSQGQIAARLLDALSGSRTIAAAGSMERERHRILEPLPGLREHGVQMWRNQVQVSSQSALIGPLLQLVVLGVAGFGVVAGQLSVGELYAASRYAALAAGLRGAMGFLNKLARTRAGGQRAAEVLNQPVIQYGLSSLPAPSGSRGRLEFRRVRVSVAGEPVINGLDLVIPGGATVAVVGRSGAGKSLLAGVVGRLVDPEQGEVFLDGVSLADLSHEQLRSAVGFAFERPALVGDTIEDVISFGSRPCTQATIHQAAATARADTFIERLPHGYSTELAVTPLSGGELQRLGLARAFAHPYRVLILDDATSSLDTVTERQVGAVLTSANCGQTRLIIAHRAATAAQTDLVAWLDGGVVRSLRPHHELWSDPDYRALFGAETSSTAPATDPGPAERQAVPA